MPKIPNINTKTSPKIQQTKKSKTKKSNTESIKKVDPKIMEKVINQVAKNQRTPLSIKSKNI